MKRRTIALLLALVLVLSLCAMPALAEEAETTETPAAEEVTGEETAGETAAPGEGETVETEEPVVEPVSPAGPDADLPEDAVIVPDEMGFVSFANLERRLRENNLNVLALQESVDALAEIDYEDLADYLRDQMATIARTQRGMGQLAMMEGSSVDSYAYDQLQAGYDSLREQFDSIKDGEMQEDNAGVMRQLQSYQDQIIMGGEMLYLSLAGLEIQDAALQRQLASLNRTVEEMNLRYQMGQISALQLQQVESGRASLVSGIQTLQMNIVNLKTQLELMIGAEMTGEIRLGAVPEVTAEQLEAMDLEKDLTAAKEVSYEIYAAEKTYEDAEEEYDEIWKETKSTDLAYKNAVHNRAAAKYTYNAAIADYELRFRTLYAQVKDYAQILGAAKTALACEQGVYASMELKFQQGTISQNALLDAQDTLRTAEEKVQTAANDLFSSYNTYCWAVQHGILN